MIRYKHMLPRRSGILLPILSFPGPYAIGDFGDAAFRFVDFLKAAGQSYWVILPLLLPDEHGSPFAPPSAFAGNWLFISPERMQRAGLLPHLPKRVSALDAPVHYRKAAQVRRWCLERSWEHFRRHATLAQRRALTLFCSRHASWLEDYCLYMAIKRHHEGRAWFHWPASLMNREPASLVRWKKDHEDDIAFYAYGQWIFHEQWQALRRYARKQGIRIIGGLPFYVTQDSVDVWRYRTYFRVDAAGHPTHIAGVPPDEYHAQGQRWGNPLYHWQHLREDGYGWWLARLQRTKELYDGAILDHFRGFWNIWNIDAREKDPARGRWETVNAAPLLRKAQRRFPRFFFIAEDRGKLTPGVHRLRDTLGLPSMRVLRFAFGEGPQHWDFPENYPENSVAFTGSHDNAPARGWIRHVRPEEHAEALAYAQSTPRTFAWGLIRVGMQCRSRLFIAQLQDVLGLGNRSRMNTPGTVGHNWRWRYTPGMLTRARARQLRVLTKASRRSA